MIRKVVVNAREPMRWLINDSFNHPAGNPSLYCVLYVLFVPFWAFCAFRSSIDQRTQWGKKEKLLMNGSKKFKVN